MVTGFTAQDVKLVVPTGPVCTDSGSDVILPAHLLPETNAVSMDIRWFKGTELIYQYKNGQDMTNNDRLTMNRVLRLNVDVEIVRMEIALSNDSTLENPEIEKREPLEGGNTIIAQDFKLVVPTGPVCTDSGSDVILPAHLLPETNAVSMDIRWFKGTELIYQYKNGREMTNNDYRNRILQLNVDVEIVWMEIARLWEERVVIKTQDQQENGKPPLGKSYHPQIHHYRFCEG
ncbi:butyrophilin 2 isoform X1 [Labeo rohita]|uniref:Butyrophilin 2 isoform X1 n=1 Tax=Labeo rohita TaxID=84645 RepID=A0A498MKA2_LABRO|nr:butyrophilin 2 isoform X1 [Labeo rohita]